MRKLSMLLLILLFISAPAHAQEALKPRLEVPFASEVEDLAFSPDGRQLVVVGRKQSWTGSATEGRFRLLSGAPRELRSVLFASNGQEVVTASYDGKIYFWNPATGKRRLELRMPRFRPDGSYTASRIALSPDGKILAIGEHGSGFIYLWDVKSGEPLSQRIAGHLQQTDATVTGLCFSPDGRLLASSSAERTSRIWDVATGREVTRLPPASEVPTSEIYALALFPDGGLIATLQRGTGDDLRMSGVASGRQCFHLDAGYSTSATAFSPGGRFLAAARAGEQQLQCWDLFSGRSSRILCPTYRLRFSPDGSTLATLPGHKAVVLWDSVALANGGLSDRTLPQKDALFWTTTTDDQPATGEEVQLAAGPHDLEVLTARVTRLLAGYPRIRLRLEQLVLQLNSPRFTAREKADQELRRLARAGGYVLRELLSRKLPPESQRRVQLALEQARLPAVEDLLWLSTVELLELNTTAPAQRLLAQLARGEPPTLAAEACAALQRLDNKGGLR